MNPLKLFTRSSMAIYNALLALTGLLFAAGPSHSAPVFLDTVTNREWRQLTGTGGFSHQQVANGFLSGNGCSASTGQCLGNLGGSSGPSLSGWTWAAELDVRTLFSHFSGAYTFPGWTTTPTSPTNYNQLNSPWAPAIIDTDGSGVDTGIFDANYVDPTALISTYPMYGVTGMTRTLHNDGFVNLVYLAGIYDLLSSSREDYVFTDGTSLPSDGSLGLWLFRNTTTSTNDPVSVTEPASIALFSSALLALAIRPRRRNFGGSYTR